MWVIAAGFGERSGAEMRACVSAAERTAANPWGPRPLFVATPEVLLSRCGDDDSGSKRIPHRPRAGERCGCTPPSSFDALPPPQGVLAHDPVRAGALK